MVVIYKWQKSKDKFHVHQEFPSNAARDVEYFQIDGNHYLAVANHRKGKLCGPTRVLLFPQHKLHARVTTATRACNCSRHVRYPHLGDSMSTESPVLRWNASAKRFEPFQAIPTIGAMDWTHFVISGYHFLAVANAFNGYSTRVDSGGYVWHSSSFVVFQTFEVSECSGDARVALSYASQRRCALRRIDIQ